MANNIETAAAVDLGSNSFHMIVAEVNGGRLKVVDKMREMVRLAGGLDVTGDGVRQPDRVIGDPASNPPAGRGMR